jgi:predicted ATPase
MKVAIKNLGAVREAEIELKPLTVFVGPNNTGKTWTAYTLSAIFGFYGWSEYIKAYESEKLNHSYPLIENAIKQLLEEGNAKVDLVHFFDEDGTSYINNVADYAKNWLNYFMDTRRVSFRNLDINIDLVGVQEETKKELRRLPSEAKLSMGKRGEALLNALKEKDNPVMYFYTTGDITEKLSPRIIRSFVAGNVFSVIHRALYNLVYYFPAERTAITMFVMPFKGEQQAEIENAESKKPIIPISFAFPITNSLETLGRSELQGSLSDRIKQSENERQVQDYLTFSELIQKEILGGKLDFSKPEPDTMRELIFQPIGSNNILDLSVVSSMVKELSPLTLYLHYIAKPRDLLVIDEPEMHLHPEAQAKLTEFLAMLVNAGLNIIITTHSPYLVDHLVNLMIAAEHSDQESIKDKFYLKRTDPFIPKENVSVYLFENGTAKNILGEEGFIDWETFSEVSEDILQIKLEL